MILFDLACGAGHRFEAWFNSSAGFEEQRARRLVVCPVCGADDVAKAVMAPRVAAKGNQRRDAAPSAPRRDADGTAPMTTGGAPGGPELRAIVAAIAAKQAEMLPQSRWVGRDFAPAARAMHEGRAPAELIHGAVSPQEAAELRADGVAALPLLVPFVPPGEAN